MATDIMGLFAPYDPYAAQQKQTAIFEQNLMQATDPRQFAAVVGTQLGSQLGQGLQGLLGGESKEQKMQAILQQVGQYSDPLVQAQEAYKLLQQAGFGVEAQGMMARIQELQQQALSNEERQAKIQANQALANQRNRQKDRSTVSERNRNTIVEYETILQAGGTLTPQQIANARYLLAQESKPKSWTDKETGDVVTIEAFDRKSAAPNLSTLLSSPGSPAAQAAAQGGVTVTETPASQAIKVKQEIKQELQNETIQNNLGTIKEAADLVGGFTAGFGSALSVIPASDARTLKSKIKTIKANLGFDRLQQMRDASPTGGALGQVAIQELEALQASVASLDQDLAPAELRANLGKVQKHYENWLRIVRSSVGIQGGGIPLGPPTEPQPQMKPTKRFNPQTGKLEAV